MSPWCRESDPQCWKPQLATSADATEPEGRPSCPGGCPGRHGRLDNRSAHTRPRVPSGASAPRSGHEQYETTGPPEPMTTDPEQPSTAALVRLTKRPRRFPSNCKPVVVGRCSLAEPRACVPREGDPPRAHRSHHPCRGMRRGALVVRGWAQGGANSDDAGTRRSASHADLSSRLIPLTRPAMTSWPFAFGAAPSLVARGAPLTAASGFHTLVSPIRAPRGAAFASGGAKSI